MKKLISDEQKIYTLKDEYTCPKCGEEIQGPYKGEYYCGSCDTNFEPINKYEQGEKALNKLNKKTNMEKINKIKTSLNDFNNVEEKYDAYKQGQEDTFNRVDELKELSKKSGLDTVFGGVEDSTDVWKAVRQYVLSRIKERYDTKSEMQDDVNEKFKSVMESIQNQYDGWYNGELLKNPTLYNIEILGDENEIVDESQMNLDENDNDIINENEMNDSNDDLGLDEEEGF